MPIDSVENDSHLFNVEHRSAMPFLPRRLLVVCADDLRAQQNGIFRRSTPREHETTLVRDGS